MFVPPGNQDSAYKFFRCQTCGLLLTNHMIHRGTCAGHRVTYAIRGTFFEWIYINIRFWIEEWLEKRKK